MKNLLLIIILLLSAQLLISDIQLNQFGRIEEKPTKEVVDLEKVMIAGDYWMLHDGMKFHGNSLFKIKKGYIALRTLEENVPTDFRIYNENGNLVDTQIYRAVINISISENGRYSAFFDKENIHLVDLENQVDQTYPASINFAINNAGELCYQAIDGYVYFNDKKFSLDTNYVKIGFFDEVPLIFHDNAISVTVDGRMSKIHNFHSKIVEFCTINGELFITTGHIEDLSKRVMLWKSSNLSDFIKIDETTIERRRDHAPIHSPLHGEGEAPWQSPIGNSYAEYQQYGTSNYLHPGVDYLGADNEPVFAVESGYVKAITSTGGSAYYRTAIALTDDSAEQEGYLYAHLNQNSFIYEPGDYVMAGEMIGTLYPWGFADFTHCHFARIRDAGVIWMSNWWASGNPLQDDVDFQDTTPPQFLNTLDDQLFAFRTASGEFLDADYLHGQFDIISKSFDTANSLWKIDVRDISYSLHPLDDPDSTIYNNFSYAFDMDLDTYSSGTFDSVALHVIYSTQEPCKSKGDYDDRDFYHIITHSNGDSLITEDDQDYSFDSSQFDDGDYILKVTIKDASFNEATAEMEITINNSLNADDQVIPSISITSTNYPNPFRGGDTERGTGTTIKFTSNENLDKAVLSIFDIKGRVILTKKLKNIKAGVNEKVYWSGKDASSGIYFYQIKANNISHKAKILLLK